MKQISIHTVNSKTDNSMKWEQVKKEFPQGYELTQQWFNEKTGTQSKVPFFRQPIWQNDLALVALIDKADLRVDTDVHFVPDKKMFRFVYAVFDNKTDLIMEPESHYATRLLAESHGLLHAYKWLKELAEKQKPQTSEEFRDEALNDEAVIDNE